MPADDSLLAQGTVEFREEERSHANGCTDRPVGKNFHRDIAREALGPQSSEEEG